MNCPLCHTVVGPEAVSHCGEPYHPICRAKLKDQEDHQKPDTCYQCGQKIIEGEPYQPIRFPTFPFTIHVHRKPKPCYEEFLMAWLKARKEGFSAT